MARSFAITTTATDILQADAQGHAQAVFTVTNSTPRPIRGLAKVKALGDTRRDWISIEGEAERDFAAGATQQFTVNFDAKPDPAAAAAASTGPAASAATPAAASSTATPTAEATPAAGTAATTATTAAASSISGVKPGKYGFRLDVSSAMKSDEDFTEGPVVTVEVAGVAATVEKKFPWWIIPVAAVVLIALGITLWLLLRTKQVDVPKVVGMTVADATSALGSNKLKANVADTKVTGQVAAGLVATQDPGEGAKVDEGGTVNLVVEAEPPAPPEDTTPPVVAPPAPFAGRWINADPNTRENTRIDILQKDTQLRVHAFGKCSPKDCDWGTVDGAVVGEFGNVTWDQGFVLRKMVIRLAGTDRILVITDSVFNDNRPRRHTEQSFKRQSRLVDLSVGSVLTRQKALEAIKADEAQKAKK